MPWKVSSSGCSVASRNTCVPGCRLSRGMLGRVATWMSHTSESATPMTTPARTPAERTPRIAATAIQKSTWRRGAGGAARHVDHAEDHRVDDQRAEHGLRQVGEQRRQDQSVMSTRPPVTSEAIGVRAPEDSLSELADRLVETGMPWNTPAPAFAMPWAIDS